MLLAHLDVGCDVFPQLRPRSRVAVHHCMHIGREWGAVREGAEGAARHAQRHAAAPPGIAIRRSSRCCTTTCSALAPHRAAQTAGYHLAPTPAPLPPSPAFRPRAARPSRPTSPLDPLATATFPLRPCPSNKPHPSNPSLPPRTRLRRRVAVQRQSECVDLGVVAAQLQAVVHPRVQVVLACGVCV